jgi:hypothetical protein
VNRKVLFGAVAATLLGLNLVKWLIASDPADASETAIAGGRMQPKDFALRVVAEKPGVATAGRDLFFGKPVVVAAKPVVRAAVPAGPPPKTEEELAQERAQAEFARLGVTGIAFRNGKGQAYVTKGDESFVVKPGDRVAERFEVVSVSADYVSLRDTETGLERQITLQGN